MPNPSTRRPAPQPLALSLIEGALAGAAIALVAHLGVRASHKLADAWEKANPKPLDEHRLKTIIGDDGLEKMARASGLKTPDLIDTLLDTLPRAIKREAVVVTEVQTQSQPLG